MMRTRWIAALTVIAGLVFGALAVMVPVDVALAHCQIPCGIYNDDMRFTMLEEHITTIEKSMKLIVELSKEPSENANQIVRWTANKEKHADELAGIVTEYFLQQRIKPVASIDGEDGKKYLEKLRLCHELLVASMKAKQTVDSQYVEKLRSSLGDFHTLYAS
jgi:nickel superoxide dismutase